MRKGYHYVHGEHSRKAHQVIYRIKLRRHKVRYWFSSNGELCGIWQRKNGKTAAVGHDAAGKVILYPAMMPYDEWNNN